MTIVMELIGVSVKPIVGKALCAKDLVPDGFLDDESRRRISGQRWYHLDFGLGILLAQGSGVEKKKKKIHVSFVVQDNKSPILVNAYNSTMN